MLITAEQKFSRQTPTRLRLAAAAVKKLPPQVAIDQLAFMGKKAGGTLLSVMKQAVANATNNLGLSADALVIKEIIVGEGPRYKRFQPVSRGRAHSILKRTSHIRVVLESQEAPVAKPKQKTVAVKTTEKTAEKKETVAVASTSKMAAPRKQMGRSQTTVKTVAVRKTGER